MYWEDYGYDIPAIEQAIEDVRTEEIESERYLRSEYYANVI